MSELETVFAAFLFSDLENSTQLWERFPQAMKTHIVRHDAIVDGLIVGHGGRVIDHAGDGVFAVFEAGDPLGCALAIQQQIQSEDWGEVGELRVRMGLHAGPAKKLGRDYRGPLVNRTARIMSTAWGGQVVVTPQLLEKFPAPSESEIQDLGVHVLKGLEDPQPIFGMVHPSLKLQTFPPLRSLSAHPNNLPPQPTPFVGREETLALLAQHLANPRVRLITVMGPGGMGKTRLALEAAGEALDQFAHGVYFVHLAPLSSPDAVVSTVADALKFNFYSRQEPKAQLLDFLREKNMLLVFDNLEHLMGTVDLLQEVLTHAAGVKLLVTSRERLNLVEENVVPLEGLSLPQDPHDEAFESYSAVKLFVESARRASAQFVLRPEDRPHLLRVCQLVGGVPLGIELAAAWARMLPCVEIAAEIEQKLDFLASSARNLPERHRSMRAVFDYSWNLLDPSERDVLGALSLLRASWDRDAAQRVAGASLLTLSALSDKSLVRRAASERFFVLEVLRQFAAERFEQHPDRNRLQAAHTQHFLGLVGQLTPQLKGAKQVEAMATLQANIDNVREAWKQASASGNAQALAQAQDGLFLFFERRSRFQEGLDAFERAGDALAASDAEVGDVLRARQGYFLYRLGQHERARALLVRALEAAQRAGDRGEQAFAQNYLGSLDLLASHHDEAVRRLEATLALCQEQGDEFGMATAKANLGSAAFFKGDLPEAKRHYEEGLALSRALGDVWSVAALESNLGEVQRQLGEFEAAKQLFQRSLESRQALGDRWGIAAALNNLGSLAYSQGDWTTAVRYHEQSLALRKELGDRLGMATSLNNLGTVHLRLERRDEALHFQEESLSLRQALHDERGAATTLLELGKTLTAMGRQDEARRRFKEAVALAHACATSAVAVEGLVQIARLLSDAGQPPQGLLRWLSTQAALLRPDAHQVLATLQGTVDAPSPPTEQTLDHWTAWAQMLPN